MKFTESVEEFQKLEENKGKIILAKCGIFMVAIGKDAVLLHKILNLNVTCLKQGICKVGIPLTHLVLYANSIEQLGYGFVLYDYDSKLKKFERKYSVDGNINQETTKCIGCKNCKHYKEHNLFDNVNVFDVLEIKNKARRQLKKDEGTDE